MPSGPNNDFGRTSRRHLNRSLTQPDAPAALAGEAVATSAVEQIDGARVAPSWRRRRGGPRWPSASAKSRLGQAAADERRSARRRPARPTAASAAQQQRHDVAKVAGLRTERHGRAVGGRLDHVLTAALAHAAADIGDLRRAPPGASSPTRSTSSTRVLGLPSGSPSALALHAFQFVRRCHQPAWLKQLGDLLEPLGMPRHEDQPQAADARRQARGYASTASRSSGSCVLPARNTTSSAAKPASCPQADRGADCARSVCGAVELERAGDVHALRRRPAPETARRIRAFCAATRSSCAKQAARPAAASGR